MSSSARRPLWLIARCDDGRQMKVLTINPCGDREVLLVFSFKGEAEIFLQFGVLAKGWHVRETMAGEPISVLYGPCKGVERATLDPSPEIFSETITNLVSVRRERFMRILMGKYENISCQENSVEKTREIAIPDYAM